MEPGGAQRSRRVPGGARRNGGRDVERGPHQPRVMARITAVKQTPSNEPCQFKLILVQVAAAETTHMFSVARTNICLVSTHSVDVSEVSTLPISQCPNLISLNCGNVTMFKSQKVAVVRLRCFRVARCQTWTILDSGQSPVMSHRDGF